MFCVYWGGTNLSCYDYVQCEIGSCDTKILGFSCSELQLMADCIQPAIGCCPLLHQVMKENMEPQRCPNVILQQACLYTTTTGKDQSTKKQRTASPVEDTKNLSGQYYHIVSVPLVDYSVKRQTVYSKSKQLLHFGFAWP